MLRQRKAMRRYGKKTLEWDTVRKELKQIFFDNGVTSCELGWPQCYHNNYLTWGHGRKRRFLSGNELKTLVILVCQNCHKTLDEEMTHEEMYDTVIAVIEKRNLRLSGGTYVR